MDRNRERTPQEIAWGSGFLAGVTAVKDCAKTKNSTLHDAANLLGSAIKYDKETFFAAFCEALLIALTAENEIHANLQFLDRLERV
jgi:hypothetical protein